MKEKVLILGSGTFQKGLISFLKSEGFTTIAITNKPNEPSAKTPHEVIDLSYLKIKEVVSIFEQKTAVQVFSVGSDASMHTQSAVQILKRLNGNSLATVDFYVNKWNYKSSLQQSNLIAKTYLVHSKLEARNLFSLGQDFIVKPTLGSGSAGVQRITSIDSLEFMSFENNSTFIIEEFIEGNEIGCDMFIYNKKICYKFITHKKVNDNLVPIGHLVLQYYRDDLLIKFLELVNERLQLEDGFYNLDIMDKKDRYYLLDISPRIGGNCIPELIDICYGLNEYEYLTRWLFHKPFNNAFAKFKMNAGVYIIGSKNQGVITDLRKDSHAFKDYEIELFWNKRIGDKVIPFNKGGNHLGYFLFKANSDEQLLSLFENIKSYQWFKVQKTEILN